MDIQDVVEHVKAVFLKTGDLPPCIFVEIDSTELAIVGVSNNGEDVRERAYTKFLTGRAFAQKKLKKRQVTAVYEAALVWMAPPGGKPSLHPQRKEGLMISTLNVRSSGLKIQSIGYELLRHGPGNLVDLLQIGGLGHDSYSASLPSFLIGIRTAHQHQSVAIHDFRRTFEKYEALVLSSEE